MAFHGALKETPVIGSLSETRRGAVLSFQLGSWMQVASPERKDLLKVLGNLLPFRRGLRAPLGVEGRNSSFPEIFWVEHNTISRDKGMFFIQAALRVTLCTSVYLL